MSFWTKIRNAVESVAVVAGNVVAPGSSALTSSLASKGSQAQLNSTIGKLAQAGASLYGGSGGSLFGGTTQTNAVGDIVSNGTNFAADAAGPGMTYDLYGTVIPNDVAQATWAAQNSAAVAGNLANGLTATGGLSSSQYSAVQAAINGGSDALTTVKNALGSLATPSTISQVLGALATGAGTVMQRNAAQDAAAKLAASSKEAADILSPAIKDASALQAGAATSAGKTLSDTALQASGIQGAGATQAANTLASGITKAATTGANAQVAAGMNTAGLATEAAAARSAALKDASTNSAGAITQGAGLQSGAALSGGTRQANAATLASDIQSDAALAGGNRMSTAALDAAKGVATGYTDAAGQRVAGNQAAISTANHTLAEQKQLQRPFLTAGTDALSTLNEGLKVGGQFNRPFTMADAQNMDAYKFALQEGKTAINNGAAAGGLQLSSANIQSLGKFAEDTASKYQQQAFEQWMSQNNLSLTGLQNMVQTGQISASQLENALSQHGLSVESYNKAIGDARAEGTLGAANATAAGTMNSSAYLTDAERMAAGYTAGGINSSAAYMSAAEKAAAGFTAGGMRDSASVLGAGTVGAADAFAKGRLDVAGAMGTAVSNAGALTAAGQRDSAAALATGQSKLADYTAGGLTAAGNATAAGGVSAAGYTAGGITGSAQAQANGVIGSGNATAAGGVAASNITANGLSAIGNQLVTNGVFNNIPMSAAKTAVPVTSPSTTYQPQQNLNVVGTDATGTPDIPSTMIPLNSNDMSLMASNGGVSAADGGPGSYVPRVDANGLEIGGGGAFLNAATDPAAIPRTLTPPPRRYDMAGNVITS